MHMIFLTLDFGRGREFRGQHKLTKTLVCQKLNNQTFHVAPPTKTLAEIESSQDNIKTQIFANPKPKPSPKPSVTKKKGFSRKIDQPKDQHTSNVDPTNKEGQDLAKLEMEKRGKQPGGLHIEEKEIKETEVLLVSLTC